MAYRSRARCSSGGLKVSLMSLAVVGRWDGAAKPRMFSSGLNSPLHRAAGRLSARPRRRAFSTTRARAFSTTLETRVAPLCGSRHRHPSAHQARKVTAIVTQPAVSGRRLRVLRPDPAPTLPGARREARAKFTRSVLKFCGVSNSLSSLSKCPARALDLLARRAEGRICLRRGQGMTLALSGGKFRAE